MPSKYCKKVSYCTEAWKCGEDYVPINRICPWFEHMTNHGNIQRMNYQEMAQMLTDITIFGIQRTLDGLSERLGVPSITVSELPEVKKTYDDFLVWLKSPMERGGDHG